MLSALQSLFSGPPSETPKVGFSIAFDSNSPQIDIVAVHSINGDHVETWRHQNGCLWLKDLLPTALPHARILLYNYDARSDSYSPFGKHSCHKQSKTLLLHLSLVRKDCVRRPIIFVCHSLGGILVKQALISSFLTSHLNEESMRIHLWTVGVLFFGTPQRNTGRDVKDMARRATQAAASSSGCHIRVDDTMLKRLLARSDWLRNLFEQFFSIRNEYGFKTKFYYEDSPTLVNGSLTTIMNNVTASIHEKGVLTATAIRGDHNEIVKFASAEDTGYIAVRNAIEEIAQAAPETLRGRPPPESAILLDVPATEPAETGSVAPTGLRTRRGW